MRTDNKAQECRMRCFASDVREHTNKLTYNLHRLATFCRHQDNFDAKAKADFGPTIVEDAKESAEELLSVIYAVLDHLHQPLHASAIDPNYQKFMENLMMQIQQNDNI